MKSKTFTDALHQTPFKPFVITMDSGKEIKVTHPEMVVLTSDKQTAVIVEGNTVNIADLVNISSINFLRKAMA